MKDKMPPSLTTYEQVCSRCIDTMYHIAYVALADEKIAEAIVTKVCVSGVHKYCKTNAETAKLRLFSDLYRRCKRKLWFYKPDIHPLPPLLQTLASHDRLFLAIYFLSGLPQEDVCRIVGIAESRLDVEIKEICVI